MVIVGIAAAFLLALSTPARADPAGPTDYRSEIVSIDPDVGGFEVEVIGGDSFVRLAADSSEVIVVVGYGGEDYLRFLPGGVVEENQASPAAYLNVDRYAVADVPPDASVDAEPRWVEVSTSGTYAWHDHRAHWMNDQPPPGAGPGDQIVEGVIPIRVGETEVDITVMSFWEQPAPLWPAIVGLLAGLTLGTMTMRRTDLVLATTLIVVFAGGAVGLSVVAFLSVPAETGPAWLLWIWPAVSLALGVVARLREPQRALLLIAASVLLVTWSVVRWDWMFAAILPTKAPDWLDPLWTGLVMVGGAAVAVTAWRSAAVSHPRRT